MSLLRMERLLVLSCWLTLIALGLFVWSVLDPDPIPVMFAMSVGQVLGTLASACFFAVLLADLLRARVLVDPKKKRS